MSTSSTTQPKDISVVHAVFPKSLHKFYDADPHMEWTKKYPAQTHVHCLTDTSLHNSEVETPQDRRGFTPSRFIMPNPVRIGIRWQLATLVLITNLVGLSVVTIATWVCLPPKIPFLHTSKDTRLPITTLFLESQETLWLSLPL
jgi:hypothetical protein